MTFTRFPMAMVRPESKVHEAGLPTMSEDTMGSSVYTRIPRVLVVGVGVDGGHRAAVDPEALVQTVRQGDAAVGGAGGVGDDLVRRRVVPVVVPPHHDGDVLALGGGADDALLGARLHVLV